ncbi:MAG: hypothetical protein JNJ47_00010 [Alphaproteobacteria bacterium]|nr:hypothetical protein [Alphaproteobacteria bacterium]
MIYALIALNPIYRNYDTLTFPQHRGLVYIFEHLQSSFYRPQTHLA